MQELDINTLIFNNKNILPELGVVVQDYPDIPKAQEEYESYDSKNGSIIYNKGTYKDISIPFNLSLVYFKDNFFGRMDLVEEWLENIVDNKLFYNRLDRYFTVKKVIKGNLKREAYAEGEFQVTFICSPFLTDVMENEIEITEDTEVLYFGTANSLPMLEIEGTGMAEILFNDNYLKVNDLKGKVTIDSELMEITYEDGTNAENNGDFPYLKKGSNTIKISYGNITKMKLHYKTLYK